MVSLPQFHVLHIGEDKSENDDESADNVLSTGDIAGITFILACCDTSSVEDTRSVG